MLALLVLKYKVADCSDKDVGEAMNRGLNVVALVKYRNESG